jgi:glycosyltransferase involved in cell wall biosynthesis
MHSIGSPAPLVSVIVPAFQAAAFIRQAIDSARDQTYQPIEILVVDDGSQDETVEIVSSIAEKDPRVRIFRQFNQGVAVARNFAITQARGEFIAPLDADDVWMPEKIEKQMRCFRQSNASVGLVYTWSYSMNQAGDTIGACPNWDLEGEVYLALLYRNFIGNASVPLIRRDHLARVGGYNVNMRAQNAETDLSRE